MNIKKSEKLIKGIKARDNHTYKAIYDEHYKNVLGYIISRGGSSDDAKDIFQDSIMVIYKFLEKDNLNIKEDFGSYFIGITKRLWLKQIRSTDIHKRFVEQSNPETTVEQHPSDVELQEEIRLNFVRKYILKLDKNCKNILMWAAEGMSNSEIAEKMEYKNKKIVSNKKRDCRIRLLKMINNDPNFKKKMG